jgi:hypothetical protein
MRLKFENEVWHWRGPSPFHFVTVPAAESRQIEKISKMVTYGWGVIPVTVQIGKTEWATSLIPKNGLYLVPLKNVVRSSEDLEIGDLIEVNLTIGI